MLVTSYSTHAPVNLWSEYEELYGGPKPRGATDDPCETVRLQSAVSNLNLLCHLKSPWTNLTLACNNRLGECFCVVCAATTGLLPALIMALRGYDSAHTQSRLIRSTCRARQSRERADTERRDEPDSATASYERAFNSCSSFHLQHVDFNGCCGSRGEAFQRKNLQ